MRSPLCPSSFSACERGTASVEVVVMLPLFVAVFLGAYHVHTSTVEQQLALAQARSCAYHFAVRGCSEDAAKADICKGAKPGKTTSVDGYTDETRARRSVLDDLQNEWGVFGRVIGAVFGEGSRASVTRNFELAGREAEATQTFYMLCNTEPSSFDGRLSEIKDLLTSKANADPMEPSTKSAGSKAETVMPRISE